MSRERNEGIPSKEMPMSQFEPFVNGVLNCHIPHHYNWALGLTEPPANDSQKRPVNNLTITDRRGNYYTFSD